MTRRRNSRKIAVLLITVCVTFTGCKDTQKNENPGSTAKQAPQKVQGQASSAKNSPVQGVQKRMSSSTVPSKVVQSQTSSLKRPLATSSQLGFAGKKDPFKPYVVQAAPAKKESASTKNVNTLPIQSYDVSKFKLEGIIVGLKENRAMIVDPMRKGYVVKVGMQLGNNNGRITSISGDALEVNEQFRDDDGKLRKRTVRLVLPQKK
jgi:type IV pilus assembly protein PilP